MDSARSLPAPVLSVIIPANNEADHITACLTALLASDWPRGNPRTGVEVLVVANGCTDDTVVQAHKLADTALARQWRLRVIELEEGSKLGALNTADALAQGDIRAYLDADVILSPPLLGELYAALAREPAAYASGRVLIPRPDSFVSRAYARIYRRVPFMAHGVPGCGLFAVNSAGRARWGNWPDIISDDTFVRLLFSPNERIGVPATYQWPLPEGWQNLLKVRRRQNAGVRQIKAKFPALLQNDDKAKLGPLGVVKLAVTDPIGFAVYGGMALWLRLFPQSGNNAWTRGR